MPEIAIRPATVDDVPTLLALVRGLAAYENLSDKVVSTEADLRRDGFGPHPAFEARIATLDGRPAGLALFYPTYSTFAGRPGLFLEDLFVEPWARGHGLGRLIMADLARTAAARGWQSIVLHVLDWNPTREFYHRLGFRRHQDWLLYTLTGAPLERLADASG
ncbi:MAG: GNAT family N-acetyltransferase [Alphaproteobacteria bacterium]|nr:GNAT family N-acetyltransferase [Alphaproteobacteria bacterium]